MVSLLKWILIPSLLNGYQSNQISFTKAKVWIWNIHSNSFEIQDQSKSSIITVTLYVQEDYHILSYWQSAFLNLSKDSRHNCD